MPMRDDFRFNQSGLMTGRADYAPMTQTIEEPGALEVLTAASRQMNTAGALAERFLYNRDPDLPEDANFDPADNLAGFEDERPDVLSKLLRAQSPSEMAGIKNRIRTENADRDVLARSGAAGVFSGLGFGLVDPTFMVSAAVPEIAIAGRIRTARAISEARRGLVGAGAYEGVLQNTQETRTATEGGANIALGVLASAALGGIARRVPKAELNAALKAADSADSTVGAAAVRQAGTLEQETLVAGGLSKAMSKTPIISTDADILMNSDSALVRSITHDLVDIPGMTKGDLEGIARPPSVELNVQAYNAPLADFMDEGLHGYSQYAKRVPKAQRLSKDEYIATISDAARNADVAAIPEAQKAVSMLRKIFDDPYQYAKKAGLVAEDALLGAKSYFMRMYDQDVIRNNLVQWKQVLENHFMKDGAELAEVRAAVNDVTDKILHNDVGQSNWSTQITVANSGRLKGRTLDIPDELIKPFLVNDPFKVAKAYIRDLAPKVEMHKRFGDIDMKQQFDNIKANYAVKEAKITDSALTVPQKNEAIKKLAKDRTEAENALIRVRDRVLGTAGRLSPSATDKARDWTRRIRKWRDYVASVKLGGVALTGGMMDTARIAAQYGFAPTIAKMAKLVSSADLRQVSAAGARRAGAMVEVAMARRVDIAAEGSVSEGWARSLANGMYKYTGLSHIMDFNRMLGASLFEDTVIRASQKIGAGKALSKYETGKLASLGLGTDELKAIAKQVEQFGDQIDGVNVSGSAHWTDSALAQRYDRAVLKESKQIVQEPGAADRVWWMDNEVGRTLGQIKTFSLSSAQRLMTPGLQMAGAGGADGWTRFARFSGYMLMGGYLTHVLRSALSGKEPETSVKGALGNAMTESGLMGIMPDILDSPSRLLTNSEFGKQVGMGEFFGRTKYADRNPMAGFLGPAVGAMGDVGTTVSGALSGKFTEKDLHNIRRNLPLQNVWFMRRPINALEGEAAEAMGLPGHDVANFGERLTRTQQ